MTHDAERIAPNCLAYRSGFCVQGLRCWAKENGAFRALSGSRFANRVVAVLVLAVVVGFGRQSGFAVPHPALTHGALKRGFWWIEVRVLRP